MFATQPLSQRNSNWQANKLGFSDEYTIGSDGCLVACVTMVANGYGHSETPASMNQKLQQANGFVGALLVWNGVARALPDMRLRNLIVCRDTPAPVFEIDAALELGHPVIVELDQSPATGLQNHWVVVYHKRGDTYLMHDPWPVPEEAGEVSVGARYGFAGNLSQLVTAAAFFVSNHPLPPVAEPVQIQVKDVAEVRNAGGLALRQSPGGTLIQRLPVGTRLTANEPIVKVGRENAWLLVRTTDGATGYVAAWLTAIAHAPTPMPVPEVLRVSVVNAPDVIAAGGLALRNAPMGALIKRLPPATSVIVQEDDAAARTKIGASGQWLRVQLDNGEIGYVAAWLVELASASRSLPRAGRRTIEPETDWGVQLPIRPVLPRMSAKPVTKPGSLSFIVGLAEAFLAGKRSRSVKRDAGAGKPLAKTVTLRAKPRTGKVLANLKPRAKLTLLENEKRALAKLGKRGQWIKVQDAAGRRGYVSATAIKAGKRSGAIKAPAVAKTPVERGLLDLFRRKPQLLVVPRPAEPDQQVTVQVTDHPDIAQFGGLGVREQAGYGYRLIKRISTGTVAHSGWLATETDAALGAAGRWLPVRLADGTTGFCAAWYLKRGPTGWDAPTPVPSVPPIPTPTPLPPTPVVDGLIVAQRTVIGHSQAGEEVRLRAAGTQDAPTIWTVAGGTPMLVAENGEDWVRKLGRDSEWVRVQTYAFKTGYVRGAQLRLPATADRRSRVNDGPLPNGVSAWLYGMHDAFDRNVFNNSGRGWALFTERVESRQGSRAYADWANAGYGVMGRLNNDYGGSGTIPTPDRYEQFASQCADWVRNSSGCFIWIIGNEMNNPREWPNQPQHDPGSNLRDEILPEYYADCFNRVRRAIKAVQPNAIVMPGALDCFQGPRMSCLDWFTRMLARIEDLDALGLHCYTNGYSPDLVSSLDTFGNDPLRWQYYHFRGYLPFLDVVPEKWRGKPVYITETDPHGPDPWSGGGNGWVQAAFGEIERYNNQPHAQQIQSLVMYRWSTDDHYSLQHRPGAQNDIRWTVQNTDYRWRA